MLNFRKVPNYVGEYYVSMLIPASENRDVVPCEAMPNADGSSTFNFGILYSGGDICFAEQRARAVLVDHPEWQACLRMVIDDRAVRTFAAERGTFAPPIAGRADAEREGKLDAERVTWEMKVKSTRRVDGGRKSIEDSPLFGGPRQGDFFQ